MAYNPTVALDLNEITVYDQGADTLTAYATITLALAAAGDGDVVRVPPGTYAENPGAIADGVTIEFWGNPTVGTGAGPAFTVASPGTGEIVRLLGSATITATTALTVAAGAIARVGPDVLLDGAVTGPWKVGRTIYLETLLNMVKAFAPADGSVVAVNEGDRISTIDSEAVYQCVDVGGTKYWLGSEQQFTIADYGQSITTTAVFRPGIAPLVSRKLLLTSGDGHFNQATATTGTNYYVWELLWGGAAIATFSTKDAAEDTSHRLQLTLNTILDFYDRDRESDATRSNLLKSVFTEHGGQILSAYISIGYREILE